MENSICLSECISILNNFDSEWHGQLDPAPHNLYYFSIPLDISQSNRNS